MTSTIEISLYPLHADYPSIVINFLQKLREIPGIEIKSNGMSTIIIGKLDLIWSQLGYLIELQLSAEDSIFVLKVAPGRREYGD